MKRVGALVVSFAGLLVLAACVGQTVLLVDPRSGATARCHATGSGTMVLAVGDVVEECLKKMESQGYIQVDHLTQQQREDLERRGLMPK